jgi:hypothetical protein
MTDPLEERLRHLRAAPLPEEMQARLAAPPARGANIRGRIISVCFAAAAAAAVMALLRSDPPAPVNDDAPVLADTSARRVEEVRPLAVITEGQRAWELVEVQWVDESTFVSTAGPPLAAQASNFRRTIVPVEIMLD